MCNICRNYYRAHIATAITTPSISSSSIFASPVESQTSQPTVSGKELEDDLGKSYLIWPEKNFFWNKDIFRHAIVIDPYDKKNTKYL